MPRNVRNFWLELDVDGRKARISTGPRAKDGGFNLTIKQRCEGGVITAMVVQGFVWEDGKLILRADKMDSDDSIQSKTQR